MGLRSLHLYRGPLEHPWLSAVKNVLVHEYVWIYYEAK